MGLCSYSTNAAFIDKGNLPEGMEDETRSAQLLDKHVQNVAPEGGYLNVKPAKASSAFGTDKVFQQKASASKAEVPAQSDASKPTQNYIPLSDNGGFGTNSAFLHKGDGEGTSVKDQVIGCLKPHWAAKRPEGDPPDLDTTHTAIYRHANAHNLSRPLHLVSPS